MALIIEDETMERLAEQLAVAEGVSVAEVVRQSLLSLAGQRGLKLAVTGQQHYKIDPLR